MFCAITKIRTKIKHLFINLQMYQQINEDNEVDFPATEKYFTEAVEGIVGWSQTIADALNACETAASCKNNTQIQNLSMYLTYYAAVENKTISTVNYKKCQVQPAIYMQCLQSHIIQVRNNYICCMARGL
jgi:hypothetical protein